MDGVQNKDVTRINQTIYSNSLGFLKKADDTKNDGSSQISDGPKGEKALHDLSKKLDQLKKTVKIDFKYEILRNPSMIVLKFVNSDNGEVVRQIPPKDSVKIAKAIDSFLGIFVDKSV